MRLALWAAALALPLGARASAAPRTKMNRLAKEKSPYLLQHADNPVDWFPWGEEAFEKARREGKPVFLSIGYSTCHWCHVMERESFVDPAVAEVLNRDFVSVKVDREERPDVDKVYMGVATAAGWGGGWPLSIWLTPDRRPFFGGTYFPPDSRWGRPGFRELSERIAELWRGKRDAIAEDARRLSEAFSERSRAAAGRADFDPAWLDRAFSDLSAAFDRGRGGFSGAPKFPMPVYQHFLLRYWARSGEPAALEMVLKTLEEMAAGGIYDHLGGGFARYSVDSDWRVPHFEKMLYDNAQLTVNYLEAYQASKRPHLLKTARETLDYVLREMTHPEGGFYSAQDADSPLPEAPDRKGEGAYYLWTAAEIDALLGSDAPLFRLRYGVEADGNAPDDPHGEFAGKNVLYARRSAAEAAREAGKTEREASRLLDAARAKLLQARSRRPAPALDDKVLASWNGLMISAFAKGYAVLEDKRYLEAARKAASFARKRLYDAGSKTLYHRWRDGERAVAGLSDDYAFLLLGLVDLYEASLDPSWLEWASELAAVLIERFEDSQGGFYMTAEGEAAELLVRVLEDADNVEPAASSAGALALARLAQLTGRGEFREAARRAVGRFGPQLKDYPRSMPMMLAAGDFLSAKPGQIVLAGEPEDPGMREMLRVVRARFLPGKTVLASFPGSAGDALRKRLPSIRGMGPIGGKTAAYVCVDFSCELPTTDPAKVAELLDQKGGGR